MTGFERAAQIWPLPALGASQRQVLTHDFLGRLIGVPRRGLEQLLEPIQSLCLLEELPPLSSLIVSADSGVPEDGFIAAGNVPAAQAEVFAYGWLDRTPPRPSKLTAAASLLPSNG